MPRGSLLLPFVVVHAGCGRLASDPWWVDQLVADSPCYRVDLVDGLDETATDEVHDLFACLDRQGHFEALQAFDTSMDDVTRAARPAALELASIVNRMPSLDVDPFAIAEVLLDALSAEDRPIDAMLDVGLELTYGVPAADVRSGAIELTSPAALSGGALSPLRSVLPVAATTLLDDELGALSFAGELLAEPETLRWARTLSSIAASTDPEIAVALDPLLTHLGQALQQTRDPLNDRWPAATGDSLRDLATFYIVRDNPVVDSIAPAIDAILSDPLVRAELVPSIDSLQARGHLAPLASQLGWLASVDVDGTPLAPGEPSALYRFVRLLAENNHAVDCEIDLLLFTIPWSFDNLAVVTLEKVADLSPGTVQSLAGLLSDLTGSPLTEELLGLAVDSGVCPSLTLQTLADLRALETLQDDDAFSLLVAVVDVLNVLERGETNHIPALADLAEALFDAGGLEPAEELIRDLGDSALLVDLGALVPVLVHPLDHGVNAGDEPPAGLAELLEIVQWSFAVDSATGVTGLQRARPLMAPMLDPDDTWTAIGNIGDLLATEGAQTAQLFDLLPRVLAIDPELVLVQELAPLLADRTLSDPLLRIVEQPSVVDALLADTPPEGANEVPLAFFARWVVSGALEDLLRFTDLVLDGLN